MANFQKAVLIFNTSSSGQLEHRIFEYRVKNLESVQFSQIKIILQEPDPALIVVSQSISKSPPFNQNVSAPFPITWDYENRFGTQSGWGSFADKASRGNK